MCGTQLMSPAFYTKRRATLIACHTWGTGQPQSVAHNGARAARPRTRFSTLFKSSSPPIGSFTNGSFTTCSFTMVPGPGPGTMVKEPLVKEPLAEEPMAMGMGAATVATG